MVTPLCLKDSSWARHDSKGGLMRSEFSFLRKCLARVDFDISHWSAHQHADHVQFIGRVLEQIVVDRAGHALPGQRAGRSSPWVSSPIFTWDSLALIGKPYGRSASRHSKPYLGCVMCERLAGARGLPAPALAGCPQRRQRHRAPFLAGYERDTNEIRQVANGIQQDTNRIRITRAL